MLLGFKQWLLWIYDPDFLLPAISFRSPNLPLCKELHPQRLLITLAATLRSSPPWFLPGLSFPEKNNSVVIPGEPAHYFCRAGPSFGVEKWEEGWDLHPRRHAIPHGDTLASFPVILNWTSNAATEIYDARYGERHNLLHGLGHWAIYGVIMRQRNCWY